MISLSGLIDTTISSLTEVLCDGFKKDNPVVVRADLVTGSGCHYDLQGTGWFKGLLLSRNFC